MANKNIFSHSRSNATNNREINLIDNKVKQDSNHLVEWTSRALQLKKKELKWKLMEASQIQNQARLEQIRSEMEQNKKKMIKLGSQAEKWRARYMKAAKAANMAESLYKKIQDELLIQEKFVADERMDLTKLAVDCRNIGTQLYGSDYVLESKLIKKNGNRHVKPTRLSSLYDLKSSILRNLASYRLTTKFSDTNLSITDLNYTHNIRPNDFVCLPDLTGDNCTDKTCLYQHKSKYVMTDLDKLVDLLSYKPSLTGYKPDPHLSSEENNHKCRMKLKQYAAKLLSKNSEKTVEVIAQNLVKYVRANKLDHELIVMTRILPKANHSVINSIELIDKTIPTPETNKTDTNGTNVSQLNSKTGTVTEDDQEEIIQVEDMDLSDEVDSDEGDLPCVTIIG